MRVSATPPSRSRFGRATAITEPSSCDSGRVIQAIATWPSLSIAAFGGSSSKAANGCVVSASATGVSRRSLPDSSREPRRYHTCEPSAHARANHLPFGLTPIDGPVIFVSPPTWRSHAIVGCVAARGMKRHVAQPGERDQGEQHEPARPLLARGHGVEVAAHRDDALGFLAARGGGERVVGRGQVLPGPVASVRRDHAHSGNLPSPFA